MVYDVEEIKRRVVTEMSGMNHFPTSFISYGVDAVSHSIYGTKLPENIRKLLIKDVTEAMKYIFNEYNEVEFEEIEPEDL